MGGAPAHAGGPVSILGWGNWILHATTKTWHGQINKEKCLYLQTPRNGTAGPSLGCNLAGITLNHREPCGWTPGRSGQQWSLPAVGSYGDGDADQEFKAGGTQACLQHSRTGSQWLSAELDTHSRATRAESQDSGNARSVGLACPGGLWTQRT